MRATNILAGFCCVLWAALLWIGIGLIEGVTAQEVPGYPNSGQIFFYIGVPAALVATLLLSAIVLNFVRRSPILLAVLSGAALLLLPFYLLVYGGGV